MARRNSNDQRWRQRALAPRGAGSAERLTVVLRGVVANSGGCSLSGAGHRCQFLRGISIDRCPEVNGDRTCRSLAGEARPNWHLVDGQLALPVVQGRGAFMATKDLQSIKPCTKALALVWVSVRPGGTRRTALGQLTCQRNVSDRASGSARAPALSYGAGWWQLLEPGDDPAAWTSSW